MNNRRTHVILLNGDLMILDLSMPCDFPALCTSLRTLEEAYGFCSIFFCGKSLLARDIPVLKIGNGSKRLLLVGGVHASEHLTCSLLLRFAADYCEAAATGGRMYTLCMPYLLETRTLYIIPMLNPDGTELVLHGPDSARPLDTRLVGMCPDGDFSHWQANARGVDLNHNFAAGFAEYKKLELAASIVAGASKYSGEAPESEPETGAVCSFIRAADIRLLAAFHTQGEEIYCDCNGYCPPMGRAIGATLARMCGYKLTHPEGGAAYGGLKDWFITEFGRPGYTFECGRGKNPLDHSMLLPTYARLREALFHLPVMA